MDEQKKIQVCFSTQFGHLLVIMLLPGLPTIYEIKKIAFLEASKASSPFNSLFYSIQAFLPWTQFIRLWENWRLIYDIYNFQILFQNCLRRFWHESHTRRNYGRLQHFATVGRQSKRQRKGTRVIEKKKKQTKQTHTVTR